MSPTAHSRAEILRMTDITMKSRRDYGSYDYAAAKSAASRGVPVEASAPPTAPKKKAATRAKPPARTQPASAR